MKKIFKKLVVLVTLVTGIGVSAFAGTYKDYGECCENILVETAYTFCVDPSKCGITQWEVTDDLTLWGFSARNSENFAKQQFIQVSSSFSGVITLPSLGNRKDMTMYMSMWCFFYKNGKHYKTIVWTFTPKEEAE